MHAFNPSTQEAEAEAVADRSLWAWGQPGLQELVLGQALNLHRETLSQKTKTKNNRLMTGQVNSTELKQSKEKAQ